MPEQKRITIPQKPGAWLFMAVFLLCSFILVLYLPDQTKFSAKGKLFAQPRFWPAVAVIGMTVFAAAHLVQHRRSRRLREASEAVFWLRGLEYVAWFMAYVWAVPRIGYLPSTVLLTVALALRVGYRGGRTLLAAAATGFAIVLIFKTFLSVKIPGGAFYETFPPAIRNFLILNF